MATIMQPYNGWQEQLAAGLITPFITDMIKRSQEANQNKKYYALMNEVNNALVNNNQNLLNGQAMPEGYNDNGWAKAFHNNYTPMTQYDMSSSNIATPFSAPTAQDYRTEISRQLALDPQRWRSLSPDVIEKLNTPFYQGLEQNRQENLRKEAIDAIRNAPDDKSRLYEAQIGAANGFIPESVLNSMNSAYQYDTLSPFQREELKLQREQANESARQFDADLARRQDEFNKNYGLDVRKQNFDENDKIYQREHPQFTNIIQGEDGGSWMVSSFGDTKKLNTGMGNSPAQLTPLEKSKLESYQGRMSELEKQRDNLFRMKTDLLKMDNDYGVGTDEEGNPRPANTEFLDTRIAEINNELGQLREGINAIWQSKSADPAEVKTPKKISTNDTGDIYYKGNSGLSTWKYGGLISKAASKYNIDPALIQSVIIAESAENPNATSPVGAQGLMQLMPGTASGLGVTNAYDPEQNINGGTKYLAELLKRYNGDVKKALWGYNAGPANADKGRMPSATEKYIKDVLETYEKIREFKKDGNNGERLLYVGHGGGITENEYIQMLERATNGKNPEAKNEEELNAWLERNGYKAQRQFSTIPATPFKK